MKQRDYKTADAPKTEPLKVSLSEKLRAAWANKPDDAERNRAYEELARKICEVNEKLADANKTMDAAIEAARKEQTP